MKWARWRLRFTRSRTAFREGQRRGFDAGLSAGIARGRAVEREYHARGTGCTAAGRW